MADSSPAAGPTSRSSNRVLAFLALVLLVPAPSIGAYVGMVLSPGAFGQVIFGISKVWLIAFPLVWMLWIDRERISWSPARQGGFALASALGVAIAAIIFAAYFVVPTEWIDAERVREVSNRTGLGTPVIYILLATGWCLVNSLIEEYVWRWFVFRKCEVVLPALNGWIAVVLSAYFFTLHHVVAVKAQFGWPITILASTGVFIGGVVWSWLYRRYRSIWPCYVSHLIVDVPIFVIGWWIIFGGRA